MFSRIGLPLGVKVSFQADGIGGFGDWNLYS
jgi:hypothetical protein